MEIIVLIILLISLEFNYKLTIRLLALIKAINDVGLEKIGKIKKNFNSFNDRKILQLYIYIILIICFLIIYILIISFIHEKPLYNIWNVKVKCFMELVLSIFVLVFFSFLINYIIFFTFATNSIILYENDSYFLRNIIFYVFLSLSLTNNFLFKKHMFSVVEKPILIVITIFGVIIYLSIIYHTRIHDIYAEWVRLLAINATNFIQTFFFDFKLHLVVLLLILLLWFSKLAPIVFDFIWDIILCKEIFSININWRIRLTKTLVNIYYTFYFFFKTINFRFVYILFIIVLPIFVMIWTPEYGIWLSVTLFIIFNILLFINRGYISVITQPEMVFQVMIFLKKNEAIELNRKINSIFKNRVIENIKTYDDSKWFVTSHYFLIENLLVLWSSNAVNHLKDFLLEEAELADLKNIKAVNGLIDALVGLNESGIALNIKGYAHAINEILDLKSENKKLEIVIYFFSNVEDNWNDIYLMWELEFFKKIQEFKNTVNRREVQLGFFNNPYSFTGIGRFFL